MKKLIMIAVTVAVVIALFGAHHHVQAQAHERLSSPFKGPAGPPIVLTSHTLITTYIDQGDANVTLSSGFTGIDNPVTFNCQSASGCTIGAESSIPNRIVAGVSRVSRVARPWFSPFWTKCPIPPTPTI